MTCQSNFKKISKINLLAGDGRNDSPGHSSQYCTYTLMEHDSNSILSVQVVDKREVQGKSTNMEKLGAELGLRHVLDAGVEIAQFVTDAHVQIGTLMSKHKIYFKWILNDCSFYYTYFFFIFASQCEFTFHHICVC